jgi:hypothetical protein
MHGLRVYDTRVPTVDDVPDKVSRTIHFCLRSVAILRVRSKLTQAVVHDPSIFLHSLICSHLKQLATLSNQVKALVHFCRYLLGRVVLESSQLDKGDVLDRALGWSLRKYLLLGQEGHCIGQKVLVDLNERPLFHFFFNRLGCLGLFSRLWLNYFFFNCLRFYLKLLNLA